MKRTMLAASFGTPMEKAYAEARKYLRRKNVIGIVIGPAIRAKQKAETAICILVDEKIAEKKLSAKRCFPRHINGIPVDVLPCRHKPFQAPLDNDIRRLKVNNPVVPGISIGDGHAQGTLGMLVRRTSDAGLYALTCAHVLPGPDGSRVYQPASAKAANLVGTIDGRLWDEDGDAVVVKLGRQGNNQPLGSALRFSNVRDFAHNEILEKSGCMTGVTRARAEYVGVLNVRYEDGSTVRINGFVLRPLEGDDNEISIEGDSGSIWYDPKTGEAVGMTVSGDAGGWTNAAEWAFACHLTNMFSRLKIVTA